MTSILVKQLKVVVLVNVFPSISETFIIDHIVGLHRKGWQVTVVSHEVEENNLRLLYDQIGFEFKVVKLPVLKLQSRLRRIKYITEKLWVVGGIRQIFSLWVREMVLHSSGFEKICADISPSLIHAHFGPNGIIASFAAQTLNIPLLVNFHGYDVNVIPKQKGWGAYQDLLIKAVAIAHSPFVRDILCKQLSIPCKLIPLGVDFKTFRSDKRKTVWNKELQLLVVGRLVYLKGIHIAIEALNILQSLRPDYKWRLSICGDGPEKDKLYAKVKSLGLLNSVAFYGELPYHEVSIKMTEADMLLVPSIPDQDGGLESFSRVAIEGMASGLAIVAFNTGGLSHTVGAGGVVVEERTALALAEAVTEMVMMKSPAGWQEKSLSHVAGYSIFSMWQQYDELSRQMLEK